MKKVLSTTPERSRIMRAVGRRDTRPELRVRRALHSLGYRFRLHRKDLPGTPDIVLPKYRTCIFVHGCFWHRHKGCKKTTPPKSNVDFWKEKFTRNISRDEQNKRALEALGWNVVLVWECETEDNDILLNTLRSRLPPRSSR